MVPCEQMDSKHAAAAAVTKTPNKTLAPSKAQIAASVSSATPKKTRPPPTHTAAGAIGAAANNTAVNSMVVAPKGADPFHHPRQSDLWRPHVESFDWMVGSATGAIGSAVSAGGSASDTPGGPGSGSDPSLAQTSGLNLAVASLPKQYLDANPAHGIPSLQFYIDSVSVGFPTKQKSDAADNRLFPHECRELGITYEAPLIVNIMYTIGSGPAQRTQRLLGNIPIMVKVCITSHRIASHCIALHRATGWLAGRHYTIQRDGRNSSIESGHPHSLRLWFNPSYNQITRPPTAPNRNRPRAAIRHLLRDFLLLVVMLFMCCVLCVVFRI